MIFSKILTLNMNLYSFSRLIWSYCYFCAST